ncbi:hypothetical protein Dimus_021210, partial [Dionaea muscipula]
NNGTKYADFLREVGTNPQGSVEIPLPIRKCYSLGELLSVVYPRLDVPQTASPEFLMDRAILSARNDDVNAINAAALQLFPAALTLGKSTLELTFHDAVEAQLPPKKLYPNPVNAVDSSEFSGFHTDLSLSVSLMVLMNNVVINGFEHIGRNFLRWHNRKNSPVDVVVVNDSGGVKNVALDIDHHHIMLISRQKVNPKEAIVGWTIWPIWRCHHPAFHNVIHSKSWFA